MHDIIRSKIAHDKLCCRGTWKCHHQTSKQVLPVNQSIHGCLRRSWQKSSPRPAQVRQRRKAMCDRGGKACGQANCMQVGSVIKE
eukprot:1161625-Pelagomonas_calceolata.AAC.31